MNSSFFRFLALACLLPAFGRAIVNGDFETGDLSGWNAVQTLAGNPPVVVSSYAVSETGGALNSVYSGNYAARLNSNCGDNAFADSSTIWQNVVVPVGYTDIEFYVAAVFLNSTHGIDQNAYMRASVSNGPTDLLWTRIDPQYTSGGILPGGVSDYTCSPGDSSCSYVDWMPVRLPLASYVGLTLTVKFEVHDCALSGHWATGFIDGLVFKEPFTPTVTPTCTPTPSVTPTSTQTCTFTISPTVTPTCTITPTFSFSPTMTPTSTITPTSTVTPTFTITPTFSASPTFSATVTLLPTPDRFRIIAVFPHPVPAAGCRVYVAMPEQGQLKMRAYDLRGELVWEYSGQWDAGEHEVFWGAVNSAGRPLAFGHYYLVAESMTSHGLEKAGRWVVIKR